jgi:hypothetical protein
MQNSAYWTLKWEVHVVTTVLYSVKAEEMKGGWMEAGGTYSYHCTLKG